MAAGFLTLKDPSGDIPDVTFTPDLGDYKRKLVTRTSVRGFTQSGAAIIQGRASQPRYEWDISARVNLAAFDRLDAMMASSDGTFADGGDGHLLLEDEIRYVYPADAPHPKTLIASLSAGFASKVHGFGRFKVAIAPNDDNGNFLGNYRGEDCYLLSFQAVELPE